MIYQCIYLYIRNGACVIVFVLEKWGGGRKGGAGREKSQKSASTCDSSMTKERARQRKRERAREKNIERHREQTRESAHEREERRER